MAPSIPSVTIPPPWGFVGHLSFLKNNVANAPTVGSAHTYKSPRWGQLIRTNPHGGAPGRVQTPDPWDKIILVNDESDSWLADPNGVSNSKGSLDFQDYETNLI